jgi:outer membrane murein-binding lipoprotein Lpp
MYKKQISDYERNEKNLRDEAVKEKTRLELKIEHLEEKVNSCESEHTAAKIELAKINERLRLLEQKGCLSGQCHVKESSTLDVQKRLA